MSPSVQGCVQGNDIFVYFLRGEVCECKLAVNLFNCYARLKMMGVQTLCCYVTAFDAEQTGRNTDWARLCWGNRT